MRRARFLGSLAVVAVALTGCRGDAAGDRRSADDQRMAAEPYWAQPDSVFVPVLAPTDAKSVSRTSMWVADPEFGAVFNFAPGEDKYVALGSGDREPTQIRIPAKLALSPEIGLSVYDGETQSIDLFTTGGEFIRGFEIEFTPAVMEFTSAPIGYVFAIASSDYEGQPRVVIIQTDALGGARDTLLSPEVGPAALRGALATPGETLITSSGRGLWVWSRAAPDSVYEVATLSTRTVRVRVEDRSAVGLMGDPTRDMLWFAHVQPDSASYSAYDTRAGVTKTFLGTRTTPGGLSPRLVHDGILMGWSRGQQTMVAVSYDLKADRFVRQELGAGD